MSPRKAATKRKPKKLGTAKKTAGVTVVAPADMERIPQPHGGALLPGGVPGNPGGGRRPDEVRAKYLEVADKGADFFNALFDGKVEFDFVGVCPHCGKESVPPLPKDLVAAIVAQINRSMEYRMRAGEIGARTGLPQKTETEVVNHPEFARQAAAFRAVYDDRVRKHAPQQMAEDIIAGVDDDLSALTGGRRDG